MFDRLRRWRRAANDRWLNLIVAMVEELPSGDREDVESQVYYRHARRYAVEPLPLNLFNRFCQLSVPNQDIAWRWIAALAERTLRAEGLRRAVDTESAEQNWMDLYDQLTVKDRQAIMDRGRLVQQVIQQHGERAGNLLSTLFLFEFDRNALVKISRLLDDLSGSEQPLQLAEEEGRDR